AGDGNRAGRPRARETGRPRARPGHKDRGWSGREPDHFAVTILRAPGLFAALCAFAISLAAANAAAQDSGAAWAALAKGGHVVLIRHANAPGTADPPGVRADDCKTQRNLDDLGRAQA